MPFFILISSFFLFSCTHTSEKKESPKVYFEKATKYKKNKNYQKALEYILRLRQNFFESSYNQKALLMTADIYFEQEKYPQALLSYRKYQKLYYNSDQAYVIYQIALCYRNQIPSRVTYDLTVADKSLLEITKLLTLDSPYKEKALKLKQEILNKKAEKELETISFFKKLGWYQAGFKRVKDFLSLYSKSSLKPKALLIAVRLAEEIKEDSTPFRTELLKEYPRSKFAKKLKNRSFFDRIKWNIL
ncbi:MAG: outer membrane protein assembly factor BamD [Bdellovibrionales bacterium]|nr:outer membrane protein assembly factor BamD [Bdellovibrionales bacterium]